MPQFMTTTCAEMTMRCGELLAPLLRAGDVLMLSGDLGAGKTQLAKGIAAGLGVAEPVTSPTFNILLVHAGRIPLYHFDLYRLDHAAQLEDLDYIATLEGDGVCVVEWGDRFTEAAPLDGVRVALLITGDDDRRIELDFVGTRGREIVSAWANACESLDGVCVGGEST